MRPPHGRTSIYTYANRHTGRRGAPRTRIHTESTVTGVFDGEAFRVVRVCSEDERQLAQRGPQGKVVTLAGGGRTPRMTKRTEEPDD